MHVSLKQARLQRYVCFQPSLIVQGQSFFSHLRFSRVASMASTSPPLPPLGRVRVCVSAGHTCVTVDDHRGRCGGHRARKVREVENVAHHLHGKIALRRLAVAGTGAPDVVVERILGSRALRARRRRCVDCVSNVCHSNAGLNSSLSSLNVAEAAFGNLTRSWSGVKLRSSSAALATFGGTRLRTFVGPNETLTTPTNSQLVCGGRSSSQRAAS